VVLLQHIIYTLTCYVRATLIFQSQYSHTLCLPGSSLKLSDEVIRSKIKSSACYIARTADAVRALKYSENLGLACSTITSKTASITDNLTLGRAPFRNYTVVVRRIIFYVSYAFISMVCLLLAACVALRLKVPTQATFFLAYILVLLLLIASCAIMVLVVRTAHSTQHPVYYAVQLCD
jgi:hypothetical protein